MFRLAKDLGRTVSEIMEMTNTEFAGWAAFYKWEHDEMKKQSNRARSK